MTNEQIFEKLFELERKVAILQDRVERMNNNPPPPVFYGPINQPNQWPNFGPPYTITCKMADGSTKEIKLDGPIVAYSAAGENYERN